MFKKKSIDEENSWKMIDDGGYKLKPAERKDEKEPENPESAVRGWMKPKKLLLMALGVLFAAGAICIFIFAVDLGVKGISIPEEYEISQDQFEASVYLEESNGEVIDWKDDYNDLSSSASKELIGNFKAKLISSMEEEGLRADDVIVTKLSRASPLTKDTKQVDEDNFSFSEFQKEYIHNKNKNSAPPQIQTKDTTIKMHSVIVTFKTVGKPSENAAAFASGVSSSTSEVTSGIANRMQANGLKTSHFKMMAAPTFVDVIDKTVEVAVFQEESGIVTTLHPNPKIGENVDCDFAPKNVTFTSAKREMTVICDSSCFEYKIVTILGGKDGLFSVWSETCISAYYIGLIGDDGGALELMHMGPSDLHVPDNAIETKRRKMIVISENELKWYNIKWDSYLIKRPGPRVIPTTPQPATVPRYTRSTTTSNPWVATSSRVVPTQPPSPATHSGSYVLMQSRVCCDGFKPEYNQIGSEARSKLETRYLNEVVSVFDRMCRCNGSGVEVSLAEAEEFPESSFEALITFRVKVETNKIVRCVKEVETRGTFKEILNGHSRSTVGSVESVQFSQGLMEELASGDTSGRRRRSVRAAPSNSRRVSTKKRNLN